VTVLEAIRKATEFLERKAVESPRLQAELLLAHVLKMPRMKLYLNFERALSGPEQAAYREACRRRGTREPLQHIVGNISFCGIEINCTTSALIPRPETELLAQLAWEFLEQSPALEPVAFDLGTGTGCLPIAIAVHCKRARIVSADISPAALALAQDNAKQCGVADRIEFIESDGFIGLTAARRFHLILSNPPYIPSAEIQTLEPEVRDFDPSLALDGGADGLDFYRRIAREAGAFLNPGGRLMLEFGDGQGPSLQEIFSGENWVVEAIRQDYSPRDRFLLARRS
jgi:release factor glutamine methyltransferase